MDQHLNLELRKAAINRLAIEARLPEIASALGLRVTSTGNPPRALCPFHNDEHPSLHLYPSSQGRRAQFHCFACSAHGDVFDLVKKQLGTDFRGALEWLSARYAIRIPSGSTRPRREMQPRFDGLAIAFDLYRKERERKSHSCLKSGHWIVTLINSFFVRSKFLQYCHPNLHLTFQPQTVSNSTH